MEIKLTGKHYVTTDNHQYVLREERKSEKGDLYKVVLGYYGTFNHLVRGLIEKEIKNDSTNDLITLKKRLSEIEQNITRLLNEVIEKRGECTCQK
ncbi:hypothetical protein [Pseudogracilibacillus auburnensis]|uniref:hypothetical protein n=1 Tax=Pseudogracilibacillus auburnensis TaxID=1494959 RepID=UPI001A96BAD1|nr:hypothetical protein [Pseudogracilibacillus auburnensis]MBO1003137.1 hypothetical protein [Pseudogracilibacillus auburnensis]